MILRSRYVTPVYRGQGLGRKRRMKRRLFFILLTVLIALYLLLLGYNNRKSIYRFFVKPISPPKTLTATELKSGKAKFTWSKVKGAKGYKIYKYSLKTNNYKAIKKFNNKTFEYVSDFEPTHYAVKAYKKVWNWNDYSDKFTYTDVTTISDMIEIVGHRGAMDKAPQNTLVSYKKAYETGYKGFETDYWETYSGDLIVCHEKDMSISTGIYKNVKELTEDTRTDYPVTNGVNVDKYATQYLPSVEEAIQSASRYKLNIYLHTKNSDLSEQGAEKIASIIKKYNMEKKATVFTSIESNFYRLKAHKIRVGFLKLPESESDIVNAIEFAGRNKADVLIMHYTEYLKKKHIKSAHNYNLKVGCYDTSNRESAFMMVDFGVDFMITNKDFLN